MIMMGQINTSAFVEALTERVKQILPAYYEEASTTASFPYAVISNLRINDGDGCDIASFLIDLWADERSPNATEQLEAYCDKLRNELTNEVISVDYIFASHVGFDNQNYQLDSEFDIAHRRLSFSARIFYY